MKRLSLLVIGSLLFATSVFTAFSQQIVEIRPQPDSPIQLSNPVCKWRLSKGPDGEEVDMLTIEFVARNVSPKKIRAYTIRDFADEGEAGRGGQMFSFTLNENGIFQSDALQVKSMGEFGSIPKPKKLKLVVDFVEFTDGSIWGQDLSKSGERLTGVRAGIKAGQEYLLKIKEKKGVEAAIKEPIGNAQVSPPNDRSDIWKSGFITGVKHIRFHLKRVYEKEGMKAAELELQKPFFLSN